MKKSTKADVTGLEIAVIGMACRFPGAPALEQFWENLEKGVESIAFFSEEELAAEGVPRELLEMPNYVKAFGIVENKENFDASFFGYLPSEAAIMDPQMRIFHECAWEALENAGYNPDTYNESIGVYAGAGRNFQWEVQAYLKSKSSPIGGFEHIQFTCKDFLSTRAAYKLNLTGPAAAVQSACSTSLTAVHLACRALLTGECAMALAGGVSIIAEKKTGYIYEEGMTSSADGHNRTFDAGAGGTVSSEGAGVVVLKRLKAALADGDTVYAVVKSSSANNDGIRKVGFTAPSVEGEAGVIKRAQHLARIEPESITYIEAHGTATRLGDSIEIEALMHAFDTDKRGYCALGSVKTNIGHTDSAAGVAGFIKTVLALYHRRIPASLLFQIPNPDIDLINSPFYINRELQEWTCEDYPLRAGVSSFGIGGTNVHVILEEAPAPPKKEEETCRRQEKIILLSARTETALEQVCRNLALYLTRDPGIDFADVAYTLQVGRKPFEHRKMVVCTSPGEAAAILSGPAPEKTRTFTSRGEKPAVVFMFPGQGVHCVNMAQELYQKEPLFRQEMDRCFDILKPLTDYDVKEILYNNYINRIEMIQPVLFTFEYALARLLMHWGIQPHAMIGHDTGEYTVSCISGVFSLEDTLKMVVEKGKSLRQLAGASLPVRELETMLSAHENAIFLELGPGNTLSTFVCEHDNKTPRQLVIPMVGHGRGDIGVHHSLLEKIGQLWLYNIVIDWQAFYSDSGEKRYRIPLPTYPFEGKPFWPDTNLYQLETYPGDEQKSQAKKVDAAGWFYIPTWKQRELYTYVYTKGEEPEPAVPLNWLIFSDPFGLGEELCKELEQQDGRRVVLVNAGTTFGTEGDRRYRINPSDCRDYFKLMEALAAEHHVPHKILHLWNVGGDYEEDDYAAAFYSLVYLSRAIARQEQAGRTHLLVVSNQLQEVTGDEQLSPVKALLLGPVKVIPQEYPFISCRSIDIEFNGFIGSGDKPGELQWLVKGLLKEAAAPALSSPDTIVALRGRRRWVQEFDPLRLEKPGEARQGFNDEGVYMIIGGLGNIGLKLAKHLVHRVKAKLVLTGRSALPPAEQWDQWLETHPAEDRFSTKIRKVRELEEPGARVLVFQADAADEERMQEVFWHAEQQFGGIDGVIYAAAKIGDETLCAVNDIDEERCRNQFQAKIMGIRVLAKVLDSTRKKPGFCFLMSSLSAVLGGLGFAAYASANAFMDYFARKINRTRSCAWISVNWDSWQSEIPVIGPAQPVELGMTAEEGVDAFQRVLLLEEACQVVHSLSDLQTRIERWIKLESLQETAVSEVLSQPPPLVQQSRSHLSVPYAAPRSSREQTLTDIWQQFFGIAPIGINDDFFEIGGDSLKAVTLASLIHKTMNIKIPMAELLKNPTIKGISTYISGPETPGEKYISIEPVEDKEYYPLSSAQKRLYFLRQMDSSRIGYNLPFFFALGKEIEKDKLERILRELIVRHESLRTSFHIVANHPVQKIHDSVEFEIEYYERTVNGQWSLAIGGENSHHSPEDIIINFVRPFDLSQAPLVRSGLIRLPDHNHVWMVDMHHIISDGTSHMVLTEDFMTLYSGNRLEPLRLHYKDFSLWQNRLFENGAIKAQEDYWLDLYADAGEIPRLELHTDFKRPEVFSFTGDNIVLMLEREDGLKFKELGSRNRGTLYMNILAALNTLFYKYTGQTDIIIGTGTAGRPHADLQHIIGMFINNLAVRNYPEGRKTYEDFLKEVIAHSVKALENQDVQFEELVDQLDVERDPSRNPLHDISMVVQNFRRAGEGGPGGEKFGQVEELPVADEIPPVVDYKNPTSKFDMTFFVNELGDDVIIDIEYYTGIFKRETLERLASHFKNLVKTVIKDPSVKLNDIDIISAEERKQVLYKFNDTVVDYPADRTIHELFARQVGRTPDHAALVYEDNVLTYKELDGKANQLAGYLHYEKGIQGVNENRVGIFMSHSLYLPIAILGILKAGGAYVPLEPSLPEDRIKYMINDASTGVVISEKRYIRALNRLQWECKGFHSYLCMDSFDIHGEDEIETSELMNEELWNHVGETAVDEITGGGWISSYTGEPLSEGEMDEYGENILKKMEPLLHKKMRVLEIGCASGISMYRIAPGVGLYYGIDLSPVIIAKNRERVRQEGYANIKLSCLAAHEIDTLEENNFDLIIMNSVIQCFHGHNYLRKVIGKCIDLIGERGYLFIGDIMDQEKKETLVRELLDFKYANREKNYAAKTDFSTELFAARGFWEDLEAESEVIEKIDVSDKIYTIENELSKFRYDVLITINKNASAGNRKKQKYQDDVRSLANSGWERFEPGICMKPNNLAYIIYTSGSTGKPKGVMIGHRGISSFSVFYKSNFRINETDRVAQFASSSFDASVWEISMALLSGAALHILRKEVIGDFKRLEEYFRENRITVVTLPPPYANHLDADAFGSLRLLITGGSASTPGLVDKWKEKVEYVNVYGPTETTICSTGWQAEEGGESLNVVPIGKPFNNTYIYILDYDMDIRPIGVPGELCIGGIGLARGYLNRAELTAERFVDYRSYRSNRTYSSKKIYKTGDLARWLPEGDIEFLGRMDQQVKLRGFRIELGEIESQLVKHDLISDAVVIDRDSGDGDKYLCAYIVLKKIFDLSELKDYLSRSLPDYMIPPYFIDIDKIPLTPGGKVDRKALPEPEATVSGEYAAPGNEVEKKLVGIWQEILGINLTIGIDDNFFALGGHSLKATTLASRIHKELQVKIPLSEVFKNQTVRALSQFIKNAKEIKYAGIEPVEKKEYYALSSAQKRMFFLQQLDLTSTSNNMPLVLPLGRDVEKDRLESALKKLIMRHESLRTSFIKVQDEPVQVAHDHVEFEIEFFDLAAKALNSAVKSAKEREEEENIIRNFVRPFDFSQVPLIRSGLIRLPDYYHIWMVDMHHIISDGTSHMVLTGDFLSLYNGEKLEPLRLQYKDFSQWQNRLFAGGEIKDQEDYWLELYRDAGEIPRLELYTDFKRPEVFTFAGDNFIFTLGCEDASKFKELGSRSGATLYMNVLAALNTLFYKYTGQQDIIIGSGTAGRLHADLQGLIGMFINTLAMRNYPEGEKTYAYFLQEVIAHSVEAFENQDVQFEGLVGRLGVERDPSRNPLFDISMVVQNFRQAVFDYRQPATDVTNQVVEQPAADENLPPVDYKNLISRFDMTFYIYEQEDDVYIRIEYYTGIFKEETVKRLAAHFKNIVKAVVKDPSVKLKDINIISEEERKQVLYEFNDTIRDYPGSKTVHELFEEQAGRTPDYVALVYEDKMLTYKELDRTANRLAGYLYYEKGIQPDDRVGILMDQSIFRIEAILGVLKSGAAYVPMDPTLPRERIETMIDDASIRELISQKRYIKTLNRLQRECRGFHAFLCMDSWDIYSKDKEKKNDLRGEDSGALEKYGTGKVGTCTESHHMAYVIYTSGTSGQPKGVIVRHVSLVNLCFWHNRYYGVTEKDNATQYAGFGFDASVWEMFPYLVKGAAVHIISDELRLDTRKLNHYYESKGITISFLPTQFCEQFMGESNHSLRVLLTGGDKLRMFTRKAYTLYNNYGPTENTVVTTACPVETDAGNIPVGRPIHNNRVYILNPVSLELQPIGVGGELCVGGDGLARGYLNRQELTAERFVDYRSYRSNRTYSSKKIYKTGDLARWLPEGDIEFLGRMDQQVKLRGFRIELREIESRLLKHHLINEAVVIDRDGRDGDKYLCAYTVLRETFDLSELKDYLSRSLPDYMLPAYFIDIDRIPLTHSGKVDRKALPEPEVTPGREYMAPAGEVEKKLVGIWQEILGMNSSIGIDDNFFALGGHSLKATTLTSWIHKELRVKVPLAEVFKNQTVRELAQFIKSAQESGYADIEPVEKKKYYALSSAQKRLYILYQLVRESTGYNIPYTVTLESEPHIEKLENTFNQLIARHESLRTSFHMVNDEPVQRIQEENSTFQVTNYNACEGGSLPGVPDANLQIADIIENFIQPFDLSRAPLLRVAVVPLAPLRQGKKYLLLYDMHHIISDGTSMEILVDELNRLYNGETLPPLKIQYKDFSSWQNSRKQEPFLKQQENYWLGVFSDEFPVLQLPCDYPRPLIQGFEGNCLDFILDRQETRGLKNIVKETGATLYMVLLAVFNVLLAKLSGQEDIIVGTPIAGRRHTDLEHTIGMFVNTLAMRNYPSGQKSFNTFLEEIKERTLAAFENQDYQFEDLVEKVSVRRDTGRNPVFDVMLNLLNQSRYPGDIPEIDEESSFISEHKKRTSRFDMSWSAADFDRFINVTLEYSTNLFTPSTIERFIRYLKNIIRYLCLPENRRQKLSEIPLLTAEERAGMLEISGGLEEISEKPQTLHRLFEERAAEAADSTALVFESRHLSYGELNRQANQLARLLREKGIRSDMVVGLMVERSIEMIIAILAILKAGGAYLPIDPGCPEQRILSMLIDSNASLLITRGNLLRYFSITGFKDMKAGDEHLVITPPRQQIRDFDSIPIPDRTLIDYNKYHRYIGEAPAKNTITMQATRGCPYNCLFCHKIWPKTHVARSAENILKEILYAYDAGLRRFVFIDDIFNLDQKNASRFLETIIKKNLDIQLFFPNGFRADILNKDFIDLMMEAGTANLAVALESASPRIQRLIKKNLNLEKFKENVHYITKKYPHVILEMEMMHGFPTETREEAAMTLDFLEELKWVHFPNLHVLKIFPNTDMCRFAIENGISEELIQQSADLAFHELPDTLPFPKSFTRQFQARFMGEYFLLKERLLDVLPHQMGVLTEDELVQKYDSYLPSEIKSFDDILHYMGISREALGGVEFPQEETYQVPDFREKISKHFPEKIPAADAFRILLLDLSQLFTEEQQHMMHHQIEEPLGLLYLMSYLNDKFKDRISGKVFKSRIDFDSYDELKKIITDFRPDLIGIRTLSFYKEFFHKAVLMIRQWGVGVPIAAGGPYATSDYRLILQDPYVDVVVMGEGELTLGQLVEKMMENGNRLPEQKVLQQIHGIAFADSQYKAFRKERSREVILLEEAAGELSRYADENLKPINTDHDLLYVIYTSGSTGKAKGLMLEHRNLANLIRYQYKYTNIDFSRVLQFTTISFDVSTQEIFSTLLAGGQLILVSKETLNDVPELFKVMEKNRLKTFFVPTSFLKFVINEEYYVKLIPGDLDHIVTAGEQLIVNEHLRKYLQENRVYLHNHYGPAETHVVTTLTLDPGEDIPELPAIGRPIMNTGIYILDKGKNPVPIGVPGELVIGGIQVGRGYSNRPELAAEKFLPVSYRSYRSYRSYIPKKFYKTGDLARWVKDRNIEFLGRIDHQVKVRGFRIEPGEIESRLMAMPGVKEAVVLDREDAVGGKYLCAYIVLTEQEVDISELRIRLSKILPDYMVPSYFVRMDEIPLTPNRKVDRKALPGPEAALSGEKVQPFPTNPVEAKLVGIWANVLQIDAIRIGIDDHFFELGGHSLKATIMMSKIHKALNVKIPLAEIFKTPTIRGLARYIRGAAEDRYASIEPVEEKEYYALSSAQKRLYILQQMELQSTAYNMPEIIPLLEEPDTPELEEIVGKLINRHESLRTSFHMLENKPVQKVHSDMEFEIEYYDLATEDTENTEGKIQHSSFIIHHSFIRPFDLSEAPLLRVWLIKARESQCILLIDMHHIISDGISHRILEQDFAALHRDESLPPLRIQYKDFAEWQNSEQEKGNLKQQEEYWLKEYEKEIPVLKLPTDYPRPAVQGSTEEIISFEIEDDEIDVLKAVAREHRSSLFMVLLAIFNIFLSKLSSQEDIIIGTPVAGRRHVDLEPVMGMFVNTLALRNYPRAEKTFSEFLEEVKNRTLDAFENQDYPFDELVEKVAGERKIARNPLFDVMFSLQENDTNSPNDPGVPPSWMEGSNVETGKPVSYENIIRMSKFDLSLDALVGEKISFSFGYSAKLFRKKTIESFTKYFKEIIAAVVEDRNITPGDIRISCELRSIAPDILEEDFDF